MPILTYRSSNPAIDGRQSELALMVQRGVIRYFHRNDIIMIPELTLQNGRRADLIGVDNKGKIILVEIKSSVEDFNVDKKWPEYLEFCDQFYFASHKDVPGDIFPEDQGFILADHYGAEILRQANQQKVTPHQRKAIMLRFARTSARRLEDISQFALSAGLDLPDNQN